jgi:tryptophan synthase alpha chain
VILHANQEALAKGIRVEQCFAFAREVTRRHSIPFLFMSYYNILAKRGVERFVAASAEAGLSGAIVPDLPPEEASEYGASMKAHGLAPIYIFSPRTPDARLKYLGGVGDGFIYAVARKGVTGSETEFSDDLAQYLARCRAATELPLAVGFGLKSRTDVEFLVGKADIAVVGSETLRVLQQGGVAAAGEFIRSLRP